MKYLAAEKVWMVLPIYLLGGLALGLADRPLGLLMQQLGARPGLATSTSVNVLLPLLAIALGVACPRLVMAWLGAVGMTGSFIFGLALVHPPAAPWNAATLLAAVRPVQVIACLGYAILGTVAALVARGWR
jgi:hypothetical protein